MRSLVFADITRHRLTESLGGSPITFPEFTFGDDIILGLRLAELVDGDSIESRHVVKSAKLSIGFLDQRPTGGSFKLGTDLDPGNSTDSIAHDETVSEIELLVSSLDFNGQTALVNEVAGGFTIQLADGSDPQLTVEENLLRPSSFVRVRAYTKGAITYNEVRLVEAPLASTSTFENILPPAPTVAVIQDGGNSGDITWNEIQSLTVSPLFRGTYQLRRGYRKTDALSVADGVERIEEALAALADEDGDFRVTNPQPNVAHIEFLGSMSGVDQDAIEVEVLSAPAGDPTLTLDLDTAELFTALRAGTSIEPTLELELTIEDDEDPEIGRTMTVYRDTVKVSAELNASSDEVLANVDWLNPPSRRTYVPFDASQIITGSQHYVAPVGDGSATTIVVAHNLGTRDLHVSLRRNAADGEILTEADNPAALVRVDSDNSVTLEFESAPATNEIVAVISTAGPVSAFQEHSHTVAQVTGLQAIIDDLGGRVENLEGLVPTGNLSVQSSTITGNVASWSLPEKFFIYPDRGDITPAPLSELAAIPHHAALPRGVNGQSPTSLSQGGSSADSPIDIAEVLGLPIPGVYTVSAGRPVRLPGYKGRRGVIAVEGQAIAYDGRSWYEVLAGRAEGNTSYYYPKALAPILFEIPVSLRQLRLNRTFEVHFGIETALLSSEANAAQWGVIVEIGRYDRVDQNANFEDDDLNISGRYFVDTPALSELFQITKIPTTHTFGLRVSRLLDGGVESLPIDAISWGNEEAAGIEAPSEDFVVRARMHWFDITNEHVDPRGVVALRGLGVQVDGNEIAQLGKAVIY